MTDMNDALSAWMRPVWQPPRDADARARQRPLYVAVMGNTGSGKSTLVRGIATMFDGQPTIGIDERETHHPYLDRLFHDPKQFAFELQLNFMLQRVLIVKRWLYGGIHVVMERSHYEDPVFIKHLLKEGLVSHDEARVYFNLWDRLAQRMPAPDLLVSVRVPVDVSVARITHAEEASERPREFRSESQKRAWVTAWGRWYDERLHDLEADASMNSRLMVVDGTDSLDDLLTKVRQRLNTIHDRDRSDAK